MTPKEMRELAMNCGGNGRPDLRIAYTIAAEICERQDKMQKTLDAMRKQLERGSDEQGE